MAKFRNKVHEYEVDKFLSASGEQKKLSKTVIYVYICIIYIHNSSGRFYSSFKKRIRIYQTNTPKNKKVKRILEINFIEIKRTSSAPQT